MVLIVFRSRLKPDAPQTGYPDMAAEMFARAQKAPGFVSFKSYAAPDGERVSIVQWTDHESLALWRRDERHREAQMLGRDQWYEWYAIDVADVVRSSEFPARG